MEHVSSENIGPATHDRVRKHTGCKVNQQIDRDTQACLERFATASHEEITEHINELTREWDMERRLQANASLLALSGVILGSTVSKKWLAIPGVVFRFSCSTPFKAGARLCRSSAGWVQGQQKRSIVKSTL